MRSIAATRPLGSCVALMPMHPRSKNVVAITMARASTIPRTSLKVQQVGETVVETVSGTQHRWAFRAHFHAFDEVVRITGGRTRLCYRAGHQELEAGDNVVVPAGALHRFEPLDATGWSFESRFVLGATTAKVTPQNSLCSQAIDELSKRRSLQTDVIGVASACAISAGYLSRLFRNEVGTSLHNFHVLLALHQSMALLRVQRPLTDAALDSGFWDQAHFTREFVRMTGMTPGRFRDAWAGTA